MTKQEFISQYTSNSKTNKYKRVLVSPIRYAGGKSLAVGHIVEHLPDDIERIISPFMGGGSIEITLSSLLNKEVIGYDIFDILVNYWDVQIKHPAQLYEKLTQLHPTKEVYSDVKKQLKLHWDNKITLDDITLASYYFFNHNLSFGPGFLGWASKIYLDENRYSRMINKVRDFTANNLSVYCDTFENIFPKYPHDFFYLDPPYYIGEGSNMFKGIYPMRNIPVHHNGFKHELLYQCIRSHKGKFILSYNDCEYIRDLYKDYNIMSPTWQYTMGLGETRIGKNRIEKKITNNKKSHELLIMNF